MLVSIQNFLRGPYSLYDEEAHTVEQIQQPPTQKWLPGDRVDPTTNKLTRSAADHRDIVGIVDFLNRTGQGFSARGIPLYMFHPLHKGYPPMIVSSKTNPKCNQLVKVNLEHWNEKWPRAGIQTVLGNVGSEVEQLAYLQSVALPKNTHNQTIASFRKHQHQVYEGFAFHIDPEGCQDVDDILSWREIQGGHEFAIGIADVAAWIGEEAEENTYAQRLGQTIYVEGKPVVPMLPEHVSTQLASLRSDGSERPVLAYIFTIRDGVCVSKRWEQQLVRVQRTYSYDTILDDEEVANKLRTFLQIVYKGPISDDSHRWIEIAMILYNQAAAILLKEHAMGVLRSQPEGRSAAEWQTLAQQTKCPELAFFGYGAGKYVKSTEPDVGHTGLQLDVYCHASSPLRRYADLYNQRCLHHILFQAEKPKRIVNWNHLNEQAKRIKHLERELWFLQHLRTDTITEVEGFLLKQKKGGEHCWSVYVPMWKRTVPAKSHTKIQSMPGNKVCVRAYTNLKAVSEHRIICSFAPYE